MSIRRPQTSEIGTYIWKCSQQVFANLLKGEASREDLLGCPSFNPTDEEVLKSPFYHRFDHAVVNPEDEDELLVCFSHHLVHSLYLQSEDVVQTAKELKDYLEHTFKLFISQKDAELYLSALENRHISSIQGFASSVYQDHRKAEREQ